VPLALAGVHVTAIEADADAAAACSRALPPGSHIIVDRVEHALARSLPADVVLLNPPRAGLSPAVRTALQEVEPPPRAILYVSCDPATLARDVAALSAWRMVSVEGFDMFPQTAHVETLCELAPERAA
jgi:tRNA/tmRNA/rRNA uracil-C5-methylase (TrmA/RlmC/RlmD family)